MKDNEEKGLERLLREVGDEEFYTDLLLFAHDPGSLDDSRRQAVERRLADDLALQEELEEIRRDFRQALNTPLPQAFLVPAADVSDETGPSQSAEASAGGQMRWPPWLTTLLRTVRIDLDWILAGACLDTDGRVAVARETSGDPEPGAIAAGELVYEVHEHGDSEDIGLFQFIPTTAQLVELLDSHDTLHHSLFVCRESSALLMYANWDYRTPLNIGLRFSASELGSHDMLLVVSKRPLPISEQQDELTVSELRRVLHAGDLVVTCFPFTVLVQR